MLNGALIASFMTLREAFRGLANVCSRVELRPLCVDLSRRAIPLDQLRHMCLRLQKRVCLGGLRIGDVLCDGPISIGALAHFFSSLHTFHLGSLKVQVLYRFHSVLKLIYIASSAVIFLTDTISTHYMQIPTLVMGNASTL